MTVKHKTDDFIEILLVGNLNWMATIKLVDVVGEIPKIRLDLTRIRFIDSEGIILLCKWIKEGREVSLVDPPDTFDELVGILKLRDILNPESLSYRKK